MDLGLNEAQQMLKTSAQEFLAAECPDAYVREMEQDERGYTPEMWQKIAEQGWLGLIFPEKYGGIGLDFMDLTILLEEMGRYLLPGPFFSTVVMGGMAIMDAGSEEQRQQYLSQISEGQLLVTLALIEPSARWDGEGVETTATQSGDAWTLNGTKLFVSNAHISDLYVVAARPGQGAKDVTLFLAPLPAAGITETLRPTIPPDRPAAAALTDASSALRRSRRPLRPSSQDAYATPVCLGFDERAAAADLERASFRPRHPQSAERMETFPGPGEPTSQLGLRPNEDHENAEGPASA